MKYPAVAVVDRIQKARHFGTINQTETKLTPFDEGFEIGVKEDIQQIAHGSATGCGVVETPSCERMGEFAPSAAIR